MTLAYPLCDFPHGLQCADCHRPIDAGQPYTDRLQGFTGGDVVSLIVCVYCG